jgi:hypothetical protein
MPAHDVMPENPQALAQPQAGESSQLAPLADLAENRRRPHDSYSDGESSSERRVRQRIALPISGGKNALQHQVQLPMQALGPPMRTHVRLCEQRFVHTMSAGQ